jgi:hypothetical protein
MKSKCAFVIAALALLSCSTYTVKVEIERDGVDAVKNAGIVMRTPSTLRIVRGEYENNLSRWIDGLKKVKKMEIVRGAPEALTLIGEESDRFFQAADGNRFLTYKSLGVINQYLRNNRQALTGALAAGGHDGLLIYEVFGVTSTEMQFVDFDTVIVLVDRDLNVLYLDHQSDNLSTDEFDFEKVKQKLLNSVSERFVEQAIQLEFLRKEK